MKEKKSALLARAVVKLKKILNLPPKLVKMVEVVAETMVEVAKKVLQKQPMMKKKET